MIASRDQLELDLPPVSRWGGRRRGAGRRTGPRPRIPHLHRPPFSKHAPCHVTLRVRRGVPSLRDGRLVKEVERSFRAAAERGIFRVVHYSLQRDHVHLLVEAEGAQALGRGMKSIGARLARAVHRAFGRRGPVLEERYHHRVLRTPREVRNALRYVLLNVKKHAITTVSEGGPLCGGIDPASSGAWFNGWTGRVAPRGGPAAVARARTWLLLSGWRRHGLIDPCEVPGRKRKR